jgi:hypothetical protein
MSVFKDDNGEHYDNRRGTFCFPIENVMTNQSKCHSNGAFPCTNESVSC